MLMPRLQHPNAYSTEMSIAMSMQHQQHHVNQLLSTAAAATGIVGDVDAPTRKPRNLKPLVFTGKPPERNLWIPDEVMQMLNIMHSIGAVSLLNNKTVKSDMVFRRVEKMMHERGYRKKSQIQIWTKWKFLKSTYNTTKRNGTIPKMIAPPVYDMLKTMLDDAEVSGGIDNSECGNSVTSLDGDSSNGGNRITISGVEGGYNSSINQGAGESEDESTLGMAHPIFGFRLGLVKQEPADTGYENLTATSDNETPEENIVPTPIPCTDTNLQFPTVIKEEPADISNSPPLLAAQISDKQPRLHSTPEMLISRQPVHVATTASTPASSSTPITASQATLTQQELNNATEKPRPPIRIAPFARVASDNAITSMPLSPPPLHAAPTAPRPVRLNGVLNAANLSLNGAIQRKPAPQTLPGIRMSKDITFQIRPATMAHTNMPRLKHVQPRNAPYALRPEHLTPDPDSASSTSPTEPPPPRQLCENLYAEGPSTSQQAMRLNSSQQKYSSTPILGSKKRRLDIPWSDDTPKLGKIPRTCNKANATAPTQLYNNRLEADDNDNSEKSFQHATTPQPDDDGKSFKTSEKEQEYFDSALKDLSLSLRQMQRDMIEDFFNQQMEMARKEHQFQLRQDGLIMQAFMEQSQNFMRMAKKLMAGDLDDALESKEAELKSKQAEVLKPKTKKKTKVKSNMETEAATQEVLRETMKSVAEQENTADVLEIEDEDENENEDEQNGNFNENEQLEYEDDEYLQENSGDNDDNEEHNDGSCEDDDDDDDDDDEDDDDDDNEDDAEASNAATSTRGDDETDPIQMVASELMEDI